MKLKTITLAVSFVIVLSTFAFGQETMMKQETMKQDTMMKSESMMKETSMKKAAKKKTLRKKHSARKARRHANLSTTAAPKVSRSRLKAGLKTILARPGFLRSLCHCGS